jgi:hypothetical protein
MTMYSCRGIVFILAILLLPVSAVWAQVTLGTACEPYGSVTIEGQPEANNLVVIAYVGPHAHLQRPLFAVYSQRR